MIDRTIQKCIGRSPEEIGKILSCNVRGFVNPNITKRDILENRILFLSLYYGMDEYVKKNLRGSDFANKDRGLIFDTIKRIDFNDWMDVIPEMRYDNLRHLVHQIIQDGPYYMAVEEDLPKYVAEMLTDNEMRR